MAFTSNAAQFTDVMDVIFVTHLVERLTRLVEKHKDVRPKLTGNEICQKTPYIHNYLLNLVLQLKEIQTNRSLMSLKPASSIFSGYSKQIFCTYDNKWFKPNIVLLMKNHIRCLTDHQHCLSAAEHGIFTACASWHIRF